MCVVKIYLHVLYSYRCTGMFVFVCACTYRDLMLVPCVFMSLSLYKALSFTQTAADPVGSFDEPVCLGDSLSLPP